MDDNPTYNSWNYETLRRKHRSKTLWPWVKQNLLRYNEKYMWKHKWSVLLFVIKNTWYETYPLKQIFKCTIQYCLLWVLCCTADFQNLFIVYNCVIEQQLPIPPALQPLATIFLFSASMNLNILSTLYKWNYAVFIFLWLAYFT